MWILYWLTSVYGLLKKFIIAEAKCLVTHPLQSVFNIISGRLEFCQQSGGETTSCIAQFASPQPPAPAFCTFPLANCHFQLWSWGHDYTLKVDTGSPFFFIVLNNSSLSLLPFTVQLSGLGGIGQSSASSSWKSGNLDLVGRQRSSSDPPNMHPPVPPMRLISTGGMESSRPLSPSLPVEVFPCTCASVALIWLAASAQCGGDLHFRRKKSFLCESLSFTGF